MLSEDLKEKESKRFHYYFSGIFGLKFFDTCKAWFKDQPDIHDWPTYSLVKTSKDYSLENLSKSKLYQCPCLDGATRATPIYNEFSSWTSQILDITSNEIIHRTTTCTDDCTNEIIRDIMCTDSSGLLSKM